MIPIGNRHIGCIHVVIVRIGALRRGKHNGVGDIAIGKDIIHARNRNHLGHIPGRAGKRQ